MWTERSIFALVVWVLVGETMCLLFFYGYSKTALPNGKGDNYHSSRVINEEYNSKATEEELIEEIKQIPQAENFVDNRSDIRNGTLPTIFAVTPTYARPVQKADLTRVGQTFLHIRNFHWIVVEDSSNKTSVVATLLQRSGINFTHLNRKSLPKARTKGAPQRNAGIEWLLENVNVNETPGVVYFADDDNTYDLQIFDEMRYTRKVSVWPVGLVGGQMYERCLVGKDGTVTDWKVGWNRKRPFPIDMAGFAINLRLLKSKPKTRFPLKPKKYVDLESSLLVQLVTQEDLEPKASNCTKILVWHTRTEKPKLVYKIKDNVKIVV
ncbi:galactosylgalactosylxylosylprotein 3-beta-glucuronosyltransferase 1-like [Acanthaster planci]|uniref:Galactosylgalactosylxylosylprotein 3-beta-glucuronosyltransferase n=1 Tax=Acanthaster planci TaxID=133434 RepID=A0A8B7YQX5_ACAPL|nr:galactosylgalactosylxylosylprotein 3-beta-glucuronosyltransferase 1-like [Acanthaster planci]